jgi:hypothetical protein
MAPVTSTLDVPPWIARPMTARPKRSRLALAKRDAHLTRGEEHFFPDRGRRHAARVKDGFRIGDHRPVPGEVVQRLCRHALAQKIGDALRPGRDVEWPRQRDDVREPWIRLRQLVQTLTAMHVLF